VIAVIVDDREIVGALQTLADRSANLRPALASIGGVLREAVLASFKAQASPYGAPWEKLKNSTLRARASRAAGGKTRRKDGKPTAKFARAMAGKVAILQDRGTLRASIEVLNVSDSSVTVGTVVPYAAVHQFGGGRNRIPARPFMPIRDGHADLPPALHDKVMGILQAHLDKALA